MKKLLAVALLFTWNYCIHQRYDGRWSWYSTQETQMSWSYTMAGRTSLTKWGAKRNFKKYKKSEETPGNSDPVEKCEEE